MDLVLGKLTHCAWWPGSSRGALFKHVSCRARSDRRPRSNSRTAATRKPAALSYALASDHGVEAELLDIAAGRTTSYLAETAYFPKVAARSWRWGPEMKEAAHALEEAGLPSDLADAAAAVMERWTGLKDTSPDLALVIRELHTGPECEPA